MNRQRRKVWLIRVFALFIVIALLVGIFLSFFQTRNLQKQIEELERQNSDAYLEQTD